VTEPSETDVLVVGARAAGAAAAAWAARQGLEVVLADAAVFLASDRAATITGTVVDLTSGNAVRTKAGALVGLLG
jgi:2-polyprenyl-6-methoxyphenol hydroxylase-like FAD-dependent oxidoreductase